MYLPFKYYENMNCYQLIYKTVNKILIIWDLQDLLDILEQLKI